MQYSVQISFYLRLNVIYLKKKDSLLTNLLENYSSSNCKKSGNKKTEIEEKAKDLRNSELKRLIRFTLFILADFYK